MSSRSRNGSFDGRVSTTCGDDNPQGCLKETLEKVVTLVDGDGRTIISLNGLKASSSPDATLTLYENEEIAGSVELNLIKPEPVEDVVVSVRGTLKGVAGHPRNFVEVAKSLWNPHQVERLPSSGSQTGEIHRVQLKGRFVWPFSLKLPSHKNSFDVASGNSATSQFIGQLPPSFSIPNCHSSVIYELTVQVRGRCNLMLSLPIKYVPTTRPPCIASPMGFARNQAINEDQWEVFHSFAIRGTAFATYSVDLLCTFAFPKPLHYTRGTSIPCALALGSTDENVLQLLGNARALSIQLNRTIEDTSTGLETKIARLRDAIKHPRTFVGSATWSVVDIGIEESREIRAAVRALEASQRGCPHSKILMGRIPLASDLTPSFSFGNLSIRYEIQMVAFKAAGFVPADGEKAIFFREDIKVASAPPIPTSTRPLASAVSTSSSPSHVHLGNEVLYTNPNSFSTSPAPAAPLPSPLPPRYDGNPSPLPDYDFTYDHDQPLPRLPTITSSAPDHDPSHQSHTPLGRQPSLYTHPSERIASLEQNDREWDSRPGREGERMSNNDNYNDKSLFLSSLRRAATALREHTHTTTHTAPRAPLPSRQCTR